MTLSCHGRSGDPIWVSSRMSECVYIRSLISDHEISNFILKNQSTITIILLFDMEFPAQRVPLQKQAIYACLCVFVRFLFILHICHFHILISFSNFVKSFHRDRRNRAPRYCRKTFLDFCKVVEGMINRYDF